MRVPEGSLTFIMNWPGSVRGKKEKSSSGNRNRLSDDDAGEHEQNRDRPLQHDADDAIVEIQKAFELRVEPGVEPVERRRAAGRGHRQ